MRKQKKISTIVASNRNKAITGNKNEKIHKEQNFSPIKNFHFLLIGICFVLLHIFLSLCPEVQRGWGLNYIQFWEMPVIMVFYAILIAALLPPVNHAIVSFFMHISRKKIIGFIARWKYVAFILISAVAFFAFRAMQVKYVFLGDCGVRPAEIEKGELMTAEYLARYIPMKFFHYLKDYDYTVSDALHLSSSIAGGLFILFALLTAEIAGKTFLQKSAYFAVSTLSLAALMQFCGYSEIYACPLLSVQIYLYLCMLYLRKKAHIIFPFLGILLALANHFLAACLLPSLAFLFYRDILWKYPAFRKKKTFVLLAIVAIPVLIYGLKHFSPMMFPLSPGEKNLMTMFSLAHYKEFINSQLLGGGFTFVVWTTILLFIACRKIKLAAEEWFWIIASTSIVGFVFVCDMWRGSGDWDIYSFAAVVSSPATAILLLSLHKRKIIGSLKYGIAVMTVFAILHTSFWIMTNHTDKSIGWVEKAFSTDPACYYKKSFSNESMLGALFSSNDLKEKSLYWERQAYLRHQDDPRTGFNYASVLLKDRRMEEATKIYEQSIVKFPAYALPYAQLVNIYMQNENYEALYKLLLQMETIYKQDSQIFTSRFNSEQMDQFFNILDQLRLQLNR
jgi:hypothetical protein